LKGIWERLLGRRESSDSDPASPERRRFSGESLEDRQADEFVEEHLGSIDPNRLLPDDEPSRD